VFCDHQDLDDSDLHEYGVNLLHDTDSGTPHGSGSHFSPLANDASSPPWLPDDLRSLVVTSFIACCK